MASWVDMSLYMEAMSLGAVDYLEKAADPAEIVRAIKLCLNHSNQPGLSRFETTSSGDKPEGNSIDSSPSFEFGGPGDC
jgi:FixJ family two-component response regulator